MTAAQAVTTAPPAYVVQVIRNVRTGDRVVVVQCPWPGCGRRHRHGWPAGHPDVGLRVSHCLRRTRKDYRVVLLPWAPPRYSTERGPRKLRSVRP